jgi:hypothetical protein
MISDSNHPFPKGNFCLSILIIHEGGEGVVPSKTGEMGLYHSISPFSSVTHRLMAMR